MRKLIEHDSLKEPIMRFQDGLAISGESRLWSSMATASLCRPPGKRPCRWSLDRRIAPSQPRLDRPQARRLAHAHGIGETGRTRRAIRLESEPCGPIAHRARSEHFSPTPDERGTTRRFAMTIPFEYSATIHVRCHGQPFKGVPNKGISREIRYFASTD